MKTPFFSIILPTYNRSDLLPKAVASVKRQTFSDWELIVVDDGSTDRTREVIGEMGEERLRYHYQAHGERSVARNAGLELAEGTYCCFLDDDDYFLPEHLSVLFDTIAAQANPVALFMTQNLVEQNGRRTPEPEGPYTRKAPVKDLWFRGANMMNFAIPRVLFRHYRFDPELAHPEDFDLLLRLAMAYPLVPVGRPTAVIVEHEGRSSRPPAIDIVRRQLEMKLRVRENLLRDYPEELHRLLKKREIEAGFGRDFLHAANGAIRVGARREAYAWIRKSLGRDASPGNAFKGLKAVIKSILPRKKSP